MGGCKNVYMYKNGQVCSSGSGVLSDWFEVTDPCVRTGLTLGCVRSDSKPANVSEDIINDRCLPQHLLMCRD